MSNQPQNESTYNEIQSLVLSTLKEIANQLKQAAELVVITNVSVIDPANPGNPVNLEAARTKMALDGDREQWIPVLKTENNTLQVYQAIADLHNKALEDSIAYRENAAKSLLDFLRTGKLPE